MNKRLKNTIKNYGSMTVSNPDSIISETNGQVVEQPQVEQYDDVTDVDFVSLGNAQLEMLAQRIESSVLAKLTIERIESKNVVFDWGHRMDETMNGLGRALTVLALGIGGVVAAGIVMTGLGSLLFGAINKQSTTQSSMVQTKELKQTGSSTYVYIDPVTGMPIDLTIDHKGRVFYARTGTPSTLRINRKTGEVYDPRLTEKR